MFNPDFWEVQLDQAALEQVSNEAGLWYESREDRKSRYAWEDQVDSLSPRIGDLAGRSLTARQLEATLLYFRHGKTQQEISQILGISRRVVSQHLFGITRKGKTVGGAVNKLRKACRKQGIRLKGRRLSI